MAEVSTHLRSMEELLKDVNTLAGWGVKGGIVAPLLDFILEIGPPWPAQIPVLTSLFELVVLIIIVSFFAGRSYRGLGHLILAALTVCTIGFLVYFALSSQWIQVAPDGSRIVAGLDIRPDVAPLLGSDYTPLDALRDGGWNPHEVWTSGSITTARLILIGSWFAAFGGFVTLLAGFALRQRAGQESSCETEQAAEDKD